MERFEYAVTLTPADEGGFVVTCRDLPQLVTQGDDVADDHSTSDHFRGVTKLIGPAVTQGVKLIM